MHGFELIVIIAISLALIFDIINGFHDAANSIATVVSTKVLSPRAAVIWAAFFNFVAMFVFMPKVADTISKVIIIDPSNKAFIFVVFAALIGAIIWNLLTWWWGLPSSSSHALVGGLIGAGLAFQGTGIIRWSKIITIVEFIPLAPLIGFALGFVAIVAILYLVRDRKPQSVNKLFRRGQLVSASLYSLGHGGNDAQKTMGVIVAILVASGHLSPDVHLSLRDPNTLWIILACHLAMALGTAFGGWRIVKTMGMKITKLKPIGGFCAETGGAITLFLATALGIPVSTTHTITGSIIGVGSVTKPSGIKWGVTLNIVFAWVLTIPMAALFAALSFYLLRMYLGTF